MSELLRFAKNFAFGKQRYAQLQGNTDCNRDCSYCDVPNGYNREKELSLQATCNEIDFLHKNGFGFLTYLGGETLAPEPFVTREGLTFRDHTLNVVKYAHNKGMAVGIVTNGDFVNNKVINDLKKAGLDSLSFSLHSFTREQLDTRIDLARAAAQAKIIPTINLVLTTKSAEHIPAIAAHTAKSGIPFSFGLVHEKGGGFSKKHRISLIPPVEVQKKVFLALLRLKTFGFIKGSRGYMQNALQYYPNNWKCNPKADSFIHLDAMGNVNVCQDVRTGIQVAQLESLSAPNWRSTKKILVENCGNCLYQCYFDFENQDILGHIPFAVIALLIRSGKADVAEKIGKYAVEASKKLEQSVNWDLQI